MAAIVISPDEEIGRKIAAAIAEIKADEPDDEWTEEDEREHQQWKADQRKRRLQEAEAGKGVGWFLAVMARSDRLRGKEDVDDDLLDLHDVLDF